MAGANLGGMANNANANNTALLSNQRQRVHLYIRLAALARAWYSALVCSAYLAADCAAMSNRVVS